MIGLIKTDADCAWCCLVFMQWLVCWDQMQLVFWHSHVLFSCVICIYETNADCVQCCLILFFSHHIGPFWDWCWLCLMLPCFCSPAVAFLSEEQHTEARQRRASWIPGTLSALPCRVPVSQICQGRVCICVCPCFFCFLVNSLLYWLELVLNTSRFYNFSVSAVWV